MTETDLQNLIRLECSDIAYLFRANVGVFYTKDGRPITTGLPKGFPDLFGFRKTDCKIVFIEVKLPNGKITEQQQQFLNTMETKGCLTGIARSVEQAREIIERK